MKKTLLFGIVICSIVMSMSVSAKDEFELRKGILFGDTFKEVKEKEELDFDDDNYDEVYYDGREQHNTVKDKLIGIPDSHVRYLFDADGKLEDMCYDFNCWESETDYDNNYKSLHKALKEKYGEPIERMSVSEVGEYATSAVIDIAEREASANDINPLTGKPLGNKITVDKIDEWILDYDDYGVKIELTKWTMYSGFRGIDTYNTEVGYRLMTKEELEDYYKEQEEISDDL